MDRRCSYVVVLDGDCGDLREFAAYLSSLGVAKCEVIIVDGSSEHTFARRRRVLCWVGRYIAARPRHCNAAGAVDPLRAALDFASCEKIVVADASVRYNAEAIDELCTLLDTHEAVEPQDYFEPLPWWSAVDAGRMLVRRGIEPAIEHGVTYAFRRAAMRGLHDVEHVPAPDVFVRRLPPRLDEWMRTRAKQAAHALFLALLPITILLGIAGGLRLAGGFTSAIAFVAFALAFRGRVGATRVFPFRACAFAPLWVLERSVSAYWTMFAKLRAASLASEPQPAAAGATAAPTYTDARYGPAGKPAGSR